jgi:hypothetical protein
MGCRHTLSTVDHNLAECTSCGVLIPGPAPRPMPACHVYRCVDDGPVLDVNGFPVCLRHDTRYRGAA